MTDSDWRLPSPNNQDSKKKRIRKIYYLREGIQLERCMNNLRRSGIQPIRYLSELGMVIGEYQAPANPNEWVPDVAYMESDIRLTITEPYVGTMVSVKEQTLPWGVQMIEAPKVWSVSQGRGVKVAVIDTGISADHPAVKENYRGGVNILSPYFAPQDYNGHGTHVSGIIAGNGAGLGIMGVAPQTEVYAVKAFNRKGSANLSDLLSAINWCIENGMQVINMSFGMEKLSESLRQAIMIAHRRGIVMVAATGNRGLASNIDFPARYPETIAVASVSRDGSLSHFSNIGKGVDIAAPGERIPSAWLNEAKREMSGTSMAVPHVSGTIALLLQLNPKLNPEQIRYILLQSAASTSSTEQIGVLNSYQAVKFYRKFWR
ncbi:S8 family peptidase [Laceyella putida]|uniref:S8 family peptidase n=1 Tax=Laceyella putida TaxID=110101 RepID=A0ABW2RK15_9BACL